MSDTFNIGDRVRGHDPDYEMDYEGQVQEIQEDRYGKPIVFVKNEAPGPFQGKRVALTADQWERA